MNRLVIVLVSLVALASAIDYATEWKNFVTRYGKQYRGEEYARRFAIFSTALDKIAAYNEEYAEAGTKFAVNIFSDLTHEEFLQQVVGNLTEPPKVFPPAIEITEPAPTASCPTTSGICDWRKASPAVVTGVKNQGSCGSCWSFSTTGALEGAWALAGNKLTSLSEQNLLDCAGSAYGNYGCDGGLMTNAYSYIIRNKGVDTESSYSYTGVQSSCKFKAASVGATMSTYANVAAGSETALTSAIQSKGPIAVAIDASPDAFMYYSSGVFYSTQCSSSALNHAVLAVGYGANQSGQAYYIVKNSWGVAWGMSGYIQMSRNRGNNCGIASMASYPLV